MVANIFGILKNMFIISFIFSWLGLMLLIAYFGAP